MTTRNRQEEHTARKGASTMFTGAAHATVEIPDGVALVEHTIFQGEDTGVTIHVNAATFPRALPE